MLIKHVAAVVVSTAVGPLLSGAVFAEKYPIKPIRMVTSQPGGGSDFIARIVAQGLSESLGQRVIVGNRGIVAAEIALHASSDGYTLLLYGSPLWIAPLLRRVPWDPIKDFAPITTAVTTPNLLVVHPSVPANTVKKLILLAKAKPGEFNYASSSTGSTQHLAAELFKLMAEIKVVRISYKGSGPALTALMGGQVQLMFPSAGSAMPHVKSSRIRALAVTTAKPSALAPGLPTLSEAGLPGYESSSPFGIFAPAMTPSPIIQRLNTEIVNILNRTETRDRLFKSGVEVVASSPSQLATLIGTEMNKWNRVVEDARIREH